MRRAGTPFVVVYEEHLVDWVTNVITALHDELPRSAGK